MSEGDTTWSLGILIGLPTIIISIATVWLLARWLQHKSREQKDTAFGYETEAKWAARACYGAIVLTVVIAAISYYPYKAEYHQYVTKVGTVDAISNRLLGSSKSFQQKFVARFSDGRTFGCEDTRCAIVKPGDTLTLACKRTWQYAGADGYDCKFIRNVSKGEPT